MYRKNRVACQGFIDVHKLFNLEVEWEALVVSKKYMFLASVDHKSLLGSHEHKVLKSDFK